MKTKVFFRNLYLRGMFVLSLVGATVMLSAQVNAGQFPPSTIQDFDAFHQWFVELAKEKTVNRDNNVQGLDEIRSAGTPHSGYFRLPGNANTFFPVAFRDLGWANDDVTVLNISRSNTHYDGMWFGSMMATFRYRLNFWTHGSDFIDAYIVQDNRPGADNIVFVGGWEDATIGQNTDEIVIWLRGGRHYFWSSNYPLIPRFNTNPNGGPITVGNRSFPTRTQPDNRFSPKGLNFSRDLWVAGTVRAREMRVDIATGADFVFYPDFHLRPLEEVEQFVLEHRHLPEIAPARYMIRDGIDVGEFQIQLLQKIEELTLYLIEQNRRLNALEAEIEVLRNR